MRDDRRIQERMELRLDRMQVIWLTMGSLVALALAFALGVVVGKRTALLTPVAAYGDALAQVDADGARHKELTFYSKLMQRDRESGAAGVGRTAVAAARAVSSGGAPLGRAPLATIERGGAASAAAAADASASGASASGASAGASASVNPMPPVLPDSAAPRRAEDARPSADEPSAAAPVRVRLAQKPTRAGEYTVQVSSFQSLDEAKAYTAVLERKGFRPFIVPAHLPGKGTWYRVRMGSFLDEDDARAAKMLLAQASIPAWVLKNE